MAWARIVNNAAVEIIRENPEGRYVAEVVAMFRAVPDDVRIGSTVDDEGVWTHPAPEPEPEPIQQPAPRVSPVEFKLLFTPAERLAIKQARAYAGEDEALTGLKFALDDFFDILDDPRLTYVDMGLLSTIGGITSLAAAGLIESARVPEILSGALQ